jgi:hypothetical protein
MAYLRANRGLLVFAVYLLIACGLRLAGIADIFPPCLISRIIGRPCPGCGLTRAGLALLRFDFRTAWDFNPMIIVVAPAAAYYLIADVRAFYRRRGMALSKQS